MRIEVNGKSIVVAATRVYALFGLAVRRTVGVASRSVSRLLSWVTLAGLLVVSSARDTLDWATSAYSDAPIRETSRLLWSGLLGRRPDVSLLVVLLALPLALVTNYWAVGVGYPRIDRWVRGTWFGTNPQLVVFVALGALVALAVLSAALNSGLVPTTVLVTLPLFGVAFSRYGQTLEPYGTVGLPNAVGVGVLLAVGFGVPIACAGFALGIAARRVTDVFRGRTDENAWTDGGHARR
ncbi:hypothetical protein [Salinigranum salinum]|uniref:hypothetical protein n=1 Tax=Salinigranum salinum TaxID=1364937 RepID=UPI001260E393|nr:hypothetical protein [Salinigranum salinum]